MTSQTGIAVLEGKWWRGWNCSVRSTFDMIAEMTCENSHAYHYEMANSLAAIDEALPRIAKDRRCRYLYLATHGGPEGLHLYNEETLSIAHLGRLLTDIPKGSRLYGLYLAACFTGSETVAAKLFDMDVRLEWLSGYQERVDWLPSSALDMFFFNELSSASVHEEREAIRQVAERLHLLVPGLIKELGFGIFVKSRGRVTNLLAD